MSVPHCILMTDLSQDSEENREETPKKRARVTYSTEQISKLEQLYGRNRYPNREIRSKLASTLNVNERQLHTWFQNRRSKEQRENSTTPQKCSIPEFKQKSTDHRGKFSVNSL